MDIIGKKILDIQPLTKAAAEQFGFDPWGCESGVMIILEDGIHLVASQDPEGNGPGCIFGRQNKEHFMLFAEKRDVSDEFKKLEEASETVQEEDTNREEACSEECAKHAPDCDGFCDHIDHQNMCGGE